MGTAMEIAGMILAAVMNIPFIINLIFAIVVVFYERKDPAVTWAWLMVIAFIPYVGFAIYLVLGLDSRKHKVFINKSQQDVQNANAILDMNIPGLAYAFSQRKNTSLKSVLKLPGAEHLNDLVYLNYTSGTGVLSLRNSVVMFYEGEAKFDAMLRDIAGAKSYVHLLYYIFRGDDLGRRVRDALVAKAREGIEVKLLIDGMGSNGTPKKFFRPIIEAGGQVAVFLPPWFVRMNYRNHRKICVVDGLVGYVGGLNIGNEYVSKVKRFGYWRDTHIRIVGDAAKELAMRFILDWNFCSKHKILPESRYFPVCDEIPASVPMQIVCSGPDTKWANILFAYTKMMTEADKNIYIQTPYFAPGDSVFQVLKIAALSGIDVRIVIPAHPDHPFVYWASLSFLGELLEAGVRCYKYEKGFIHSKLIVIDGLVSSTGTANMDIRSFKLNFEVNAFIYDRQIANAFEIQFLEDLKECTEITMAWYQNRPKTTRIKESVSRLLAPLL